MQTACGDQSRSSQRKSLRKRFWRPEASSSWLTLRLLGARSEKCSETFMTRKIQNKSLSKTLINKVHESARKPTSSSYSVCEQTHGDDGMEFWFDAGQVAALPKVLTLFQKFLRACNKKSALILLFSDKIKESAQMKWTLRHNCWKSPVSDTISRLVWCSHLNPLAQVSNRINNSTKFPRQW